MNKRMAKPHVTQSPYSVVYKNAHPSRKHPFLSGLLCFVIVLIIAIITIPFLFTSSCVSIYNPVNESWNKQIPVYTSRSLSERKAEIQPYKFHESNTFIAVVNCNYECFNVTYRTSNDPNNTWNPLYTSYLGNDQYSLYAYPVSIHAGTHPLIVTYRIEICSDQGTEVVYFSTKN